eukprot:TRINITY_DN13569_c0_g1_i1.p1 TRINITY_DN13569_c0_g1~~TRINITY_DN13569_c0_g1_i1.p1  ORF type:complete len:668 (+),score=108.77 TRINITY_DN13569_c0_g1_i1:87-2090(+)
MRQSVALLLFTFCSRALGDQSDNCKRITQNGYTYEWCSGVSVKQYHSSVPVLIGHFDEKRSTKLVERYNGGSSCGNNLFRSAAVIRKCCQNNTNDDQCSDSTSIMSRVTEPRTCHYEIEVCDNSLCPKKANSKPKSTLLSHSEILELREEAREMFYHAYNNYMKYSFPSGELRPLTCDGGEFSFSEIPCLTLIDTLDTLAVMGDFEEFKKSVIRVTENIQSFNIDVKVSVFETNIRVLGGLLSAHIIAEDKEMIPGDWGYHGELLTLAKDLGDRLLMAFRDLIPIGTVNLLTGVPKGETPVASVAGAGSLSLEMAVLSLLTGDSRYLKAGMHSTAAIYAARSNLNLVGKHIDTETHEWIETGAGIGVNADSYYEYLLKTAILTGDEASWSMFADLYESVASYISSGDFYPDVAMHSGTLISNNVEGLLAFWPGMQTLIGDLAPASRTLNALMSIWRQFGSLPELVDSKERTFGDVDVEQSYLLRPELIESLVYMRRATNDNSWLLAGKQVLRDINTYSRTPCGFAIVGELSTGSPKQQNQMPSFFLSETVKYLFMLFDDALTPEGSRFFGSDDPYVFSTEAHPFPIKRLRRKLTDEMRRSMPMASNSGVQVLQVSPLPPLWVEGYNTASKPKPGAQQPNNPTVAQHYNLNGLSFANIINTLQKDIAL